MISVKYVARCNPAHDNEGPDQMVSVNQLPGRVSEQNGEAAEQIPTSKHPKLASVSYDELPKLKADPAWAPDPWVVDMCYDIVEEVVGTALRMHERASSELSPLSPSQGSASNLSTMRSAWEQLHPAAESEDTLWFPLPQAPHLDEEEAHVVGARSYRAESYSPYQEKNLNPVRNVLNMLPILPDRITPLGDPELHLEKVDDYTVDMQIVHSFRAHYDRFMPTLVLPAPGGSRRITELESESGSECSMQSGATGARQAPAEHRASSFRNWYRGFGRSHAPAAAGGGAVHQATFKPGHRRTRSEGGGVPDAAVVGSAPGGTESAFRGAGTPGPPGKPRALHHIHSAQVFRSTNSRSYVSSPPVAVPGSSPPHRHGGIPMPRRGSDPSSYANPPAPATPMPVGAKLARTTSRPETHVRSPSTDSQTQTQPQPASDFKPGFKLLPSVEVLENKNGAVSGAVHAASSGGWREAWDVLMAQEEEESVNEIVSPTEQLEPNLFRGSPPGTTVGLLDPAHANGQRSGEGSDISSVMQAPELARADSTGNWEVDPSEITYGQRLAVGGFAEVFKGRWQGTVVAVKRLLDSDKHVVERLKTEVKVLAKLRHPNLLLFMGYHTQPPIIVSEFMKRGSLHSYLRKRDDVGGLDPQRLKAVLLSVARGMNYLHARNPPILHLDLKSPNILIDDKWRVKIADFGLSKMRQRTFVSSSSGGGGTPEWMAPEVLRSERYDEGADVYSFGVVLWECLTGESPWSHLQNPLQVVYAVGVEHKQLPLPENVDPLLEQLYRDCCHRVSAQRIRFGDITKRLEKWGQAIGDPGSR